MKFQRPLTFGVAGKANSHLFCLSQVLSQRRTPQAQYQSISAPKCNPNEFVFKLLDRRWGLHSPVTPVQQILLSSVQEPCRERGVGKFSFSNNTHPHLGDELLKENHGSSFYILRDDLLHPLVNGNKARKLDALLPLLEDHSVTDVVTCGGCQSAHTAAVAVSCAERGLKSHLLLRGEQPEILTGYNLVSTMYSNVHYIPRTKYAHRDEILKMHADLVAGKDGHVLWCKDIVEASLTNQAPVAFNVAEKVVPSRSKPFRRKVVIVNEGAGDSIALLGIIRLVQYLSQDHLLGKKKTIKFVVDAGTGTTAVGLGLAAMSLGLPWEINAVMLADTLGNYKKHEARLVSEFADQFLPLIFHNKQLSEAYRDLVNWVEPERPRKFGKVLEGEMELCKKIAEETGILVDPVYTLAAWEMATRLTQEAEAATVKKKTSIVMLHTGGTLGMFGLAQRYKSYFNKLKDIPNALV